MSDGIIQNRESSRRFFYQVWQKHQIDSPMDPMEKMVLEVLLEHPEYHYLLEGDENVLMQEFSYENGMVNPFLHMGMHITIQEQIQVDRPAGIADLYVKLAKGFETAHDLEHRMMECLGETLWTAQRDNTLPDEAVYLECVRRIR